MVLLFDMGGVLVDLDLDLTLAGFDQIGIDLRPYLDSARQAGFLSDYESGKINTETMLSKMRALSTKSDLTDDEIAAAWCRLLVRLPQERLELILKARRHYRVALLSNTNPLSWGKARTEFIEQQGHTVSDFFDETFLSFEMGVEKPAPEIFQKAVEALHCRPEEVLFFDDAAANCEAARREGLRAFHTPTDGSWMQLFDDAGRLKDEANAGY